MSLHFLLFFFFLCFLLLRIEDVGEVTVDHLLDFCQFLWQFIDGFILELKGLRGIGVAIIDEIEFNRHISKDINIMRVNS